MRRDQTQRQISSPSLSLPSPRGILGSRFADPIIVYSVANSRPHLRVRSIDPIPSIQE